MSDSQILSYPAPESIQTVDELIRIRRSLPKVRAGDPLQGYKWQLSCRLRTLRTIAAGPLPAKVTRELFDSAPKYCPICDVEMKFYLTKRSPSIDHIVPLSAGGTNARTNLRVICNRCNSRKGAKSA